MTSAPPTATKLANPKSQLGIRLWDQIITISETLRRIISNLCAKPHDFLVLRTTFRDLFTNPHHVGVRKVYRKHYSES